MIATSTGLSPAVDAELAVAVERDRPQVRGLEAVDGEGLEAGGAELLGRVRELHVEQAAPRPRAGRGGRRAGRRRGRARSRSSGCPRRLRCRSAGRARRRGSGRPPSPPARRSSRSSRSPASAPLSRMLRVLCDVDQLRPRDPGELRRRQPRHVPWRARPHPQRPLGRDPPVEQDARDAGERDRCDRADARSP